MFLQHPPQRRPTPIRQQSRLALMRLPDGLEFGRDESELLGCGSGGVEGLGSVVGGAQVGYVCGGEDGEAAEMAHFDVFAGGGVGVGGWVDGE